MEIDFFVTILGFLTFLCIIHRFLKVLYRIVVPYLISCPLDLKKISGADWAVITGATDGIGKAFAFELAKRGFNIILISRTQSKLDATKRDIRNKYEEITVETYANDFTNADICNYEKMIAEINDHNVGILINNVGMLHDYPEVLHKTPGGIKKLADISLVNMLSPLLLSAGILDQMVERRAGIIVNVSSTSGQWATPMFAIYSSSKKFVTWLSEILRQEYSSKGVIVQTINPMMVATKMSNVEKTNAFIANPEEYAKSALDIVGHASDTTGYLFHQIQFEVMQLVPTFIRDYAVETWSRSVREKALRERR